MGYIRGIIYDDTGAPAAGRTVRAYRRDTGALIGTAVTGSGSGALVAGDANANFKMLLLNFDGSNGSTTFTDSSLKARTPSVVAGNVQNSTAQFKYGSASGYFDGAGDYISYADSTDWDPGTGDMTMHCWVRPDATTPAAPGRICGQCTAGGGQSPLIFTQTTAGVYNMSIYNGAGFQGINSTAAATGGVWKHLAATKIGTSMVFYVDGVSQGSLTIGNAGQLYNSADPFSIGRMGAFADQYYKGFIDDFEFVKGLALWTGNFTPPSSKRSGALAGSGGAAGEYMIDVGGYTGEIQRIVLDDAAGVVYNDLIKRVIAG